MKIIALIQKNILLVLLGTSVPYIVGYLLYKYFVASPVDFSHTIWTNLYDIALTLLGSGIFLATLKYFQFLGFFLDEIKKVIYSDDYLKEQKNIYEIWQRVTKALFKSELPEPIVDNMLSEIFKNFLTKETLDSYYKSSDVRYSVSIDDDGYVEIEESISYQILSKEKRPIPLKLDYFVSLNGSDDKISTIQLQKFLINDSVIDNNDADLQMTRSNTKQLLTFNRTLENLQMCEVEYLIRVKQSINVDREFYYKSNCVIENMTITIDNKTPEKLGIIFVEMGISSFKKSTLSDKIYKGENILPNNGFRLFFYTKQ
jgi:hypothetical protein